MIREGDDRFGIARVVGLARIDIGQEIERAIEGRITHRHRPAMKFAVGATGREHGDGEILDHLHHLVLGGLVGGGHRVLRSFMRSLTACNKPLFRMFGTERGLAPGVRSLRKTAIQAAGPAGGAQQAGVALPPMGA